MTLINFLREHFNSKLGRKECYVKKKDIKDTFYKGKKDTGNLHSTWSQLVKAGYLSQTCNPMIYKILKQIPDELDSSNLRKNYNSLTKSRPL